MTRHDVVVVGLGALGSAALLAIARRGARVLGLDRFRPPHSFGSSHGRTRIIREAYFEDPLYVPLVRRAYDGWRDLEQETGRQLLRTTGGLMLGPEDGELVAGTLASARAHELPHERLDAAQLAQRFPALAVPEGTVGVVERRAGILEAEGGVRAALHAAREAGAEIRTETPMAEWKAGPEGAELTTPDGRHAAAALVLAAGPWSPALLGPPRVPGLRVERQVQFWFEAAREPARFRADALPVAVWEHAPGRFFYLIPDTGHGLKAAVHHEGAEADPDRVDRAVTEDDERTLRILIERFLPGAAGRRLDASVCLYTNTRDTHFMLGAHPEHPSVVLLGGGSGHAFKFAPALGELAAELALDGHASVDLTPFTPARLFA